MNEIIGKIGITALLLFMACITGIKFQDDFNKNVQLSIVLVCAALVSFGITFVSALIYIWTI